MSGLTDADLRSLLAPGPSLHQQLADLFSRYVRCTDGVERQQLGARLDRLAPLVVVRTPGL